MSVCNLLRGAGEGYGRVVEATGNENGPDGAASTDNMSVGSRPILNGGA
ncbi:MAG TPA: hypothetical protein VKF36_00325 [Syntrophorhabdales bacterium]|nr:hypothetical protein [Syntrophorhabdales bacterium]